MNISIINGPNLNLIGERQPEIYGAVSFKDYIPQLIELFSDIRISYLQSNHEGTIIDELHRVGFRYDGIVLNAGAYTHTSIAIADAISSISTPVVEVHISDIYSRENFRRHSYLSDPSMHTIVGEGIDGYKQAIKWLIDYNIS